MDITLQHLQIPISSEVSIGEFRSPSKKIQDMAKESNESAERKNRTPQHARKKRKRKEAGTRRIAEVTKTPHQ
jgi:hypothetical protein